MSRWLNLNSRFYLWQKKLFRSAKSEPTLTNGNLIFSKEGSEDLEHAWSLTRALIANLAREVRQDGAKFAVAILPSAMSVYSDAFEEVLERGGSERDFDQDYPQVRLERIGDELGVTTLDMVEPFRSATPDGSSADEAAWLFLGGRGHFTERGNELAASLLHELVLSLSDD
jgi:hypothetical protein